MTDFDAHSYDDHLRARRVQGQAELAGALRVLVERELPEAADAIATLSDDQILLPQLFGYFSQPSAGLVPLPQLLWGMLPPDLRPDGVEVRSDAQGVVFVPSIGDLVTDRPDASLVLADDGGRLRLLGPDGDVRFRHEPPLRLRDHDMTVVRRCDPMLWGCLGFNTDSAHEPRIVDDPAAHIPAIEDALAVIARAHPRYHDELRACVRTIVLFTHPSSNSFAALGAHGAVFFNLRWLASRAFFVDEMSHQGGHVVFHAATTNRREYLVEPDLPLAEVIGRDEHRTLYDTLHGLYTEHVMSRVMRAADEIGALHGIEAEELFGRLGFITKKWRVDLSNMGGGDPRSFNALGQRLLDFYRREHEALTRTRPDVLEPDYRGHSYEFDFPAYQARNPSRVTTPAQRHAG